MKLSALLFGKTYQFKDIKDVLAKANELRSGDVLAGIAAETSQERVAAKYVLANLTWLICAIIRSSHEEDAVTRVIRTNQRICFRKDPQLDVGELREYALRPHRRRISSVFAVV